jgi:hypothetical protein
MFAPQSLFVNVCQYVIGLLKIDLRMLFALPNANDCCIFSSHTILFEMASC